MTVFQGPLDGSGYGYCALTLDGQTPIKTGNVAGGLVGVRVAQRLTIDGKKCRLPVVYQCVPYPLSLLTNLARGCGACVENALLQRNLSASR